ncbi:MAG: tRNA pseudouridine(55) synthase TruB [Cyanobacteria bacterium P01_H01_bin.119]
MDGFLSLNKPVGWTSHDCVAKLRRLLKIKKIGHAGTLDPAATGVLPIAVGRATRLIQYLPGDKVYRAVIRFGLTTSTDDLEGDPLTEVSAEQLSLETIQAQIPNFIGTLNQIPPRYSAIQVQGQRLYDLARRGETVEVPLRQVQIDQFKILNWHPGRAAELTAAIACGSGTYIRSIARDLGQAVGTGGTLANLVRTCSSGFELSESLTLEGITARLEAGALALISPTIACGHLPQLTLESDQVKGWLNGQKLAVFNGTGPVLPLNQPLRVASADYGFLGIAELRLAEPESEAAKTPVRVAVPKLVFHPR